MDTGRHRQQKYRFSLILLPVMALLLTAAIRPSMAQYPQPPGGQPPFDEQKVLQLDPGQKERFTQFETTSRDKKKKLIDQIRDLRHQLWDAYQAYNLDTKRVKALNRELNKVQQDLLRLHYDEQIELRKILTADQFARLQAAIHQSMEAAKNRWHHDDHGNPEWQH